MHDYNCHFLRIHLHICPDGLNFSFRVYLQLSHIQYNSPTTIPVCSTLQFPHHCTFCNSLYPLISISSSLSLPSFVSVIPKMSSYVISSISFNSCILAFVNSPLKLVDGDKGNGFIRIDSSQLNGNSEHLENEVGS